MYINTSPLGLLPIHVLNGKTLVLQFMLPVHYRVFLCRCASLVPALIAALFEATHPSVMDELTQCGNVITSVCVPFAILPMLKFCTSPRIMGVRLRHVPPNFPFAPFIVFALSHIVSFSY